MSILSAMEDNDNRRDCYDKCPQCGNPCDCGIEHNHSPYNNNKNKKVEYHHHLYGIDSNTNTVEHVWPLSHWWMNENTYSSL